MRKSLDFFLRTMGPLRGLEQGRNRDLGDKDSALFVVMSPSLAWHTRARTHVPDLGLLVLAGPSSTFCTSSLECCFLNEASGPDLPT